MSKKIILPNTRPIEPIQITLTKARQSEDEKIYWGDMLLHESIHQRDYYNPTFSKDWIKKLKLTYNQEHHNEWKNVNVLEKGIINSYAHFSYARGHTNPNNNKNKKYNYAKNFLHISNTYMLVCVPIETACTNADLIEQEVSEFIKAWDNLPSQYKDYFNVVKINPSLDNAFIHTQGLQKKDWLQYCGEDRAVHIEQFYSASRHPQYYPALFTLLDTQDGIKQRLELLVKDKSVDINTAHKLTSEKKRKHSGVYSVPSSKEVERESWIKKEPELFELYNEIKTKLNEK